MCEQSVNASDADIVECAGTSLPIISAVTTASSATGMSLVPADTTAIMPLP